MVDVLAVENALDALGYARRVERVLRPASAGGIRSTGFEVLEHLDRAGGAATPGQLVQATGIAKWDISRALGRLHAAGHVDLSRRKGSSTGHTRVLLTPTGRAALSQLRVALSEAEDRP